MNGFTADIAHRASLGTDAFDDPVARQLVGHCLLDWVACAIGGSDVPCSRIAREVAAEQGAAPQATVIGTTQGTSPLLAAQVNGVISHALDFDDANLAMPGHPGVVLFPALLALGEARNVSGRAFVEAFLAGYDAACRIGTAMATEHYARGFHATGTIGTFAAAAGCARLLGLDVAAMRQVIGLAATQASGLIAMFGTDAKPLHAGNAAAHGLSAALLAEKGFSARADALECAQGFAAAMGAGLRVEAALAVPPLGHHIYGNLFKLHAACYGTHATIECGHAIRRLRPITAEAVRSIHIRVGEECTRTCDIRAPRTGQEAKFSLRFNAAAALLGWATGDLAVYSEASAANPALISLRDKVEAEFVPGRALTEAEMAVSFEDGTVQRHHADTSVPCRDLPAQAQMLTEKYRGLVAGRLPADQVEAVLHEALDPDALNLRTFMQRLRHLQPVTDTVSVTSPQA